MRPVGLLLLLMVLNVPATAQTTVVFADSSRIWVDGSSNRSDWTVRATAWSAEMLVDEHAPAAISLSVDVMAMESGKSTIMDRLMQRTMMADVQPHILFSSTSMQASPASDSLSVTGDLSMAGESRTVDVAVHADSSHASHVIWTGQKSIKLTDFGMSPPTAMFGALHTSDDVIVHFRLISAR